MTIQYLPDIMAAIVTKVQAALGTPVYFEFGSDPVVTQELTIKDNSINSKDKKYPLIWLVVPYEEVRGKRLGIYAEVTCDVCIVTDTKIDYSMLQRANINFKPILYPIYAELIKQITAPRSLIAATESLLSHTKIDYPYWGKNKSNLFNDYIDAIMLKGLKLTIKNTELNC
jgi:hypothetical protein